MERGDRPWGYYLVLREDAGYKVKRFVVRPGSRLGLHRHRRHTSENEVTTFPSFGKINFSRIGT